jgi:hypothetical protein
VFSCSVSKHGILHLMHLMHLDDICRRREGFALDFSRGKTSTLER